MDFRLIPLRESDTAQFKKDMQAAFLQGALGALGTTGGEILPLSHIEHSLSEKGAIAYEALFLNKPVGGAIVVIDRATRHNRLDFLYVKNGCQNKGFGQRIWTAIEQLHPQTKVWETCTPYFDKRNIHFYVNCCCFHIVEFFNRHHPDPNAPDETEEMFDNEEFEGMFRFEKSMN